MGLKPDHWIKDMVRKHRMIEPFVDQQVRAGSISYGLSSYGYDLRVSDEFKIFTNVHSAIVDPKHFDDDSFVDFRGDVLHHPAQFFCLVALGGILQNPAQRLDRLPGQIDLCALWLNRKCPHHLSPNGKVFVTLEISNTTPLPAKVYANEGLAQVLFFEAGRCLRAVLCRQKGQISRPDRCHAAAHVSENRT